MTYKIQKANEANEHLQIISESAVSGVKIDEEGKIIGLYEKYRIYRDFHSAYIEMFESGWFARNT